MMVMVLMVLMVDGVGDDGVDGVGVDGVDGCGSMVIASHTSFTWP